MQFMNSSLEKLVKNLSDNDFKYLTEEFGSKNLELLKHVYPHMDMDNNTWTYMDSFNRLMRHKECFYRFANHGETGDHGEKLDRHISDEHLLDVHQNWMKFNELHKCQNKTSPLGPKDLPSCKSRTQVLILANKSSFYTEC